MGEIYGFVPWEETAAVISPSGSKHQCRAQAGGTFSVGQAWPALSRCTEPPGDSLSRSVKEEGTVQEKWNPLLVSTNKQENKQIRSVKKRSVTYSSVPLESFLSVNDFCYLFQF